MCPGTLLGKGMELRRTERIHLDERPRQDGCHALPAGLPCYSLAPGEGLAGKSLKLSCARPPTDGRSGELLGSGSAPRASSWSPARSRRGRTWTPSAAGAGQNGPRDEPGNRPEPPAAGNVQVRAGGEGFEPPRPLRALRLSRPPRSSAPASPRRSVFGQVGARVRYPSGRYGWRTSGRATEPSSRWWFSSNAIRVRPIAQAVPLRVWTGRFPSGYRT